MTAENKINKPFTIILFTTFALKLILAAWFPVTGDEAYFTLWGQYPDYGYYDHPPMLGWWLAAQMQVSDALWWLRLPSVLVTTAIGWAIYQLYRRRDEQIAAWVACLYLLAPINLFTFVIANDIPLLLWAFLSALAFHRAQNTDDLRWYLVSGILLGLAFLSKFFAGVLGITYAVYVLAFVRRGLRPWLGIALVFVGAMPAIAINLLWNYQHCWNNYLFNLFNRTRGGGISLSNLGLYLLILVYAVTPPILVYLIQSRSALKKALHEKRGTFIALFIIGMGLLLLIAARQPFGVHWLLAFYPLLFMGLPAVLTPSQLRTSFLFMLPFTAVHVLLVFSVLLLPISLFKVWPTQYQFIVFGKHTGEVMTKVEQFGPGYVYATDNYTLSATAAYHTKRPVIVFGGGSQHGRQDDLLTDFRRLDGRNILLVQFSPDSRELNRQYFDSVEFATIEVRGARFYVTLGRTFNYEAYRQQVLKRIRSTFYNIPAFLPVGSCYMFERYSGPAHKAKHR
ncbi:MAG: glycosyltransferase family 39 protein [Acidiferrobacterales bacterium]